MSEWLRPKKKTDDMSRAFGGDMKLLLPKWDDIPDEFKRHSNKWVKIQQTWFFSGIPYETLFIPNDDIDDRDALKHLMAIQQSWEPKHEHKEAGVAYLMSLWFKDIIIPK